MKMEEKNKQIKEYLKLRFYQVQNQYPGIFNSKKYDDAIRMFENLEDDLDNIKVIIEQLIELEIEKYEILRKNQISLKGGFTYDKIKSVYKEFQNYLTNSSNKVYLAGGLVPYILLNQESKRLHNDIDTICLKQDIDSLRLLFKQTPFYKNELDSLNYANDGNDYGFEIIFNNVPIGIYPFEYVNGKIIQYTWSSYTKEAKIKELQVGKLNRYIKSYTSVDGSVHNTMGLEYIKKSKDLSNRAKDKYDSKKIAEYGINQETYNSIVSYKNIKTMRFDISKKMENRKKKIYHLVKLKSIVSRSNKNDKAMPKVNTKSLSKSNNINRSNKH